MMQKTRSLVILLLPLLTLLLQGCIAAAAGGAATGAAVATDRRTAGTIVEDQAIEMKALHALTQEKGLWQKSHITAVCYNNVLLLVGQAPTHELKQQAEAIMSDIPKIRSIHNEIIVEAPISLVKRSKDSWITTQIKTKLIGSKEISANKIKVVTENGIVYLMGITTPLEKMVATDIARAIPGVVKVIQIFEDA